MPSQRVKLNMIPGSIKPRVYASQHDSGIRTVEFSLYYGDDPYSVEGNYITIDGTKSDGTAFSYSVVSDLGGSVSGNIVTWSPNAQMTILAESILCELVVWNGNGSRIGSGNFYLEVETGALGDDVDVSSQTELSGLMEELQEVATTQQQTISAAESATAAAIASTTELESIRSTLNTAVGKIVDYSLSGTVLTITTADYTGE